MNLKNLTVGQTVVVGTKSLPPKVNTVLQNLIREGWKPVTRFVGKQPKNTITLTKGQKVSELTWTGTGDKVKIKKRMLRVRGEGYGG